MIDGYFPEDATGFADNVSAPKSDSSAASNTDVSSTSGTVYEMANSYTGESIEGSVVQVAGPGSLHKTRVATNLQADEAAALLDVISNTKSVAQRSRLSGIWSTMLLAGRAFASTTPSSRSQTALGAPGVRDLAAYHSTVAEDLSEESSVEEGEDSVCDTLWGEGDENLVQW